jgi:Ca2+-binding EF-hand superfamily protein
MRALGFPVKKADVLQVLRDVNAESTGRVEFADFMTISEFVLGISPSLRPSIDTVA